MSYKSKPNLQMIKETIRNLHIKSKYLNGHTKYNRKFVIIFIKWQISCKI